MAKLKDNKKYIFVDTQDQDYCMIGTLEEIAKEISENLGDMFEREDFEDRYKVFELGNECCIEIEDNPRVIIDPHGC